MLRFINLDGQVDDGFKFAWFDTVQDKFLKFNGSMVWDSWTDFETDFKSQTNIEIDRFLVQFPSEGPAIRILL